MASRPAKKKQRRLPGSGPRQRTYTKPGTMYQVVEYGHAERLAKELLGPKGAVRFVKRNAKYKYWVGEAFADEKGKPYFGLVGEGRTWQEALDDAAERVRKYEGS